MNKNVKKVCIVLVVALILVAIITEGVYYFQKNSKEETETGEVSYTSIGKILLNCVDENGNPVSGCKFELSDPTGKVYGDVTTGDDGIIKYYKVPEGEYILKQVETDSEYEPKETSKSVIVEAGKTAEVTFVNSLIRN